MGSVNDLLDNFFQVSEVGFANLKDIKTQPAVPKEAGVYKLYYQDKLMKVGEAPEGLKKKLMDCYAQGNSYITEDNRDQIKVKWRTCKAEKLEQAAEKMRQQAKEKGRELPWGT